MSCTAMKAPVEQISFEKNGENSLLLPYGKTFAHQLYAGYGWLKFLRVQVSVEK